MTNKERKVEVFLVPESIEDSPYYYAVLDWEKCYDSYCWLVKSHGLAKTPEEAFAKAMTEAKELDKPPKLTFADILKFEKGQVFYDYHLDKVTRTCIFDKLDFTERGNIIIRYTYFNLYSNSDISAKLHLTDYGIIPYKDETFNKLNFLSLKG